MRAQVLSVLIALAAGLAGCDSLDGNRATGDPQPVANTGTGSSGSRAQGGASGADPVARYALSAQSGDSAQLQTSDGAQVFVTVGSMYTSAAGVKCRRITLRTQRDASRVSAVCRQADGWHTVLQP